MKTILVVFGTRPEAIKLAWLLWNLETERAENDSEAAQHREMLDRNAQLFSNKAGL